MTENITRSEEPVDFLKFGADAKTVKDIYQNPEAIHKLIIAKREANNEAKEYREIIETNAEIIGVEASDLARYTELYTMAKRGQVKIDDLDADDVELIEVLALNGAIDPKSVGIDDNYLSELHTALEAAFSDGEAEEELDEKQGTQLDPEVEAIRAENARLKLVQKFIAEGADPKQAETLARLWDEPELPESYVDKDGKPLEGEAAETEKKRIISEHMQSFKANYGWGFAQPKPQDIRPPANTHGAPIVPPAGGVDRTAYEQAKARGDVDAMLRLRDETTQT